MIGDLAKMLIRDDVAGPRRRAGRAPGRDARREDHRAPRSPAAPARQAFRYRDKGNMATIGRASAVVATKRVAIHGVFAWLMWWAVHIMFLVGFKNRVLVMFEWAWSWLTFQRGARLITGDIPKLPHDQRHRARWPGRPPARCHHRVARGGGSYCSSCST